MPVLQFEAELHAVDHEGLQADFFADLNQA